MKNLNKLLVLMSAPLLLGAVGCGNGNIVDNNKLNIVSTIYSEYEWVNAVTKGVDNISSTLLIDGGADLHSYQPSVEDIAAVSSADLFIYVGGESDTWVADALKNKTNENQKAINLLETLGDAVKPEEEKEGMQEEEHHHHHDEDGDHDHDHDHEHEGEEEEEVEYDEHVWNSLVNAKKLVTEIKDQLVAIDAANKVTYEANASAYITEIDNLHNEYVAKFATATKKTQVVADRFPFLYMFNDYSLDYYAAFKGCSAESEASMETVIFLANKVDTLELPYIIRTSNSNGAIANTVKENTTAKNQTIVTLDSLETKPQNASSTYLTVMAENLNTLYEACK